MKSLTPYQLKARVQATGSCFFDRSSMRFFGDTMRNYGCYQTTIEGKQVYALHRKQPVKYGLQSTAFFNAVTFERIITAD